MLLAFTFLFFGSIVALRLLLLHIHKIKSETRKINNRLDSTLNFINNKLENNED